MDAGNRCRATRRRRGIERDISAQTSGSEFSLMNMLYGLVRPLLFAIEAERAHRVTLAALNIADALGIVRCVAGAAVENPRNVMGIDFPNPIGLAAGLDKNGDHIRALSKLGFGFIEIGTVTPRPQPGNPPPRLFRIPAAQALINRMGFNNHGVERLVRNVRAAHYTGVLGINIGKNFDTPIERAGDDYVYCLRLVYDHASYVTVNISSPNTQNLRDLQQGAALEDLLAALDRERDALAKTHGRRVPIALKIAPDLDETDVRFVAETACRHHFDAIIATNTTISRTGVENLPHGNEAGGLSGAPLREQSTRIVRWLSTALAGRLPIIAAGGILSTEDAMEKIAAGASLIQLYSGLVYCGPQLIAQCARAVGQSPASPG